MFRPILRRFVVGIQNTGGILMTSKREKAGSKAIYGESMSGKGNVWYQTIVTIPPKPRGVHIITDILQGLPELKSIKVGLATLTIQHTSASISLNECWDGQVRDDMEMMLNRIAPENAPYTHTLEGSDDMPAHVKTSLIGASITVPITKGKLNIGTWQGVWLCEHRNNAGSRRIVVTLQGSES